VTFHRWWQDSHSYVTVRLLSMINTERARPWPEQFGQAGFALTAGVEGMAATPRNRGSARDYKAIGENPYLFVVSL
jgi:hypothetical protein